MTVQPTRDQLRALADAATPGPWENTWNGVQQSFDAATRVGEYAWEGVGIVPEEYVREHDAEFIAAARTAVPQLLDQLDRAEHRIARLEAQSDIRGRAVVMYRERAREAEAERDWNWRSSRHSKIERIRAIARADRAEAEARAQRRRADDMEDNALRAQTNLRAAEERVDEWRQAALEESATQLPDASHIAQPPRDGRMRA